MVQKRSQVQDNRRRVGRSVKPSGTRAVVRAQSRRLRSIPLKRAVSHEAGKAEQELRTERDKLQGILDAISPGIYIASPQHEVVYCSAALAEEFGPVNGRKCYQYMHGREHPCPWCRKETDPAGEPVRHEWVSDVSGKAYELVATSLANEDGSVSKVHTLHDITARKRAEDALRASAALLRSLSTHLLQTQETGKRNVSRQLHDVLAQALGTLKLRLSLVRNQLHEEQHEARADCNETLRYLDQAIETVRRLSRDLCPTILEDLGLGAALRRLVRDFSRLSHTAVVSRVEDIGRLPSKDAETMLFRIFQEALENVQKHAHARNVSVVLERRDLEIQGLVEDDGIGFAPAEVARHDLAEKGMGLTLIAERTRMLGGTLDIRSEPGKGTKLSFSIPMQDERTR